MSPVFEPGYGDGEREYARCRGRGNGKAAQRQLRSGQEREGHAEGKGQAAGQATAERQADETIVIRPLRWWLGIRMLHNSLPTSQF